MRPRRFVSYLRTRGDLEAHHDCFGIPEPSTVQAISRSGRQLKPVVVAWVGFSCFCRFLTPLFTTPRGLRFASRGISPVMCAQTCYYSVLGTHFRPLQAKSRFENSLFTRQSAWRERTVNLDRYTVCTRAAHARPSQLEPVHLFSPPCCSRLLGLLQNSDSCVRTRYKRHRVPRHALAQRCGRRCTSGDGCGVMTA